MKEADLYETSKGEAVLEKGLLSQSRLIVGESSIEQSQINF